jgi:hypothetical protein
MSLPEMERAMGWSKRWLLALWLGASGIILTDARGQDRAPAVRLGAPITQAPVIVPAGASTVQRVQFQQAQPPTHIVLVQGEAPVPAPPVFPAGPPPSAPPPAFSGLPGSAPAAGFNPNQQLGNQGTTQFFSQAGDYLGITGCTPGRRWFQSDHGFDQMISPVTNPFYFEDPRALTEVRPIFMYQSIPGSNPAANGNIFWYGTQLRAAFTEKLSLTINKLGGISATGSSYPPLDPSAFDSNGFSEFWITPKWTFYRDERSGTVAAAGMQLQIPTTSNVYQNTGNLGLTPFASVGQTFGRTSYGAFNTMGMFAYDFGANNQRSDFLVFSAHLDYDIANWHKIYPFLDLNWSHVTAGGNRVSGLNVEGADLVNFGASNSTGWNQLTLAPGLRYKFSENIQTGVAFEFPISSPTDTLLNFRLTLDVIFRY